MAPNLLLSGELLQELHKTYRYLRVVPDEHDGRAVLLAAKSLYFGISGKKFDVSDQKWDTIPVTEPPANARTVVQIYPNRIWDIEELL